jgi:hypothetical protein
VEINMIAENQARVIKLLALVAALGYSAAATAASAVFEKEYSIENTASIEVSNGSGSVDVHGADVDQVTIRARISIDDRYARRDAYKANKMVRDIRAKPPIRVDGDRIVIEQPKNNTQRRHATISYEILVPRNAQVTVQSESGDVRVSGISGPVNATSETGVVTVVKIDFRNAGEAQLAAR